MTITVEGGCSRRVQGHRLRHRPLAAGETAFASDPNLGRILAALATPASTTWTWISCPCIWTTCWWKRWLNPAYQEEDGQQVKQGAEILARGARPWRRQRHGGPATSRMTTCASMLTIAADWR